MTLTLAKPTQGSHPGASVLNGNWQAIENQSNSNESNIASNTSNINSNSNKIGDLSNLNSGLSQTNLTAAVNSADNKIGNLSNLNSGISQTDIVSAVNSVDDKITAPTNMLVNNPTGPQTIQDNLGNGECTLRYAGDTVISHDLDLTHKKYVQDVISELYEKLALEDKQGYSIASFTVDFSKVNALNKITINGTDWFIFHRIEPKQFLLLERMSVCGLIEASNDDFGIISNSGTLNNLIFSSSVSNGFRSDLGIVLQPSNVYYICFRSSGSSSYFNITMNFIG